MLAVLDNPTTTNVEEMILTEEQLSLLLRREEEAIVLTEEQEQVLSELLEFINDLNPDNNEHILCGPAGVGKSVVASQFIIFKEFIKRD